MAYNIAIDGPAGAGKSTIARKVAQELSFIYVDTGAMYRTIALGLIRRGIGTEQTDTVAAALGEMDVSIAYEQGEQRMLLNGEDVSDLIRTEEVSAMTSKASALGCVREKLLELQRRLAREHDVIMDGRDIGTHILPHAQLKIYLTASIEARAQRRYAQLREKGLPGEPTEIRREIEERDYRDMHREIAPLQQAKDAVFLDTSDLSIEQVTGRILKLYHERTTSGLDCLKALRL